MAVLFTNLVTYLQVAVIDRRLVNPAYLLPMTGLELIFIVVWTMIFQMVYRNMFPPRRMLFIEGDRKDYHLMDKINAREDKYQICEVVSYKKNLETIKKKMELYDAVVIGICLHMREISAEYCYISGIRSYSVPRISTYGRAVRMS